jgi:serine/threonine protein kinase
MTVTYPCTFENAAEKPLEETLLVLQQGSMRKVRTLSEAIHGKIKLVESFLPDHPSTFVVKQISKAAVCQGLESPRNEIHASLAISCSLQVPNTAKVFFAAQDEKFFYLASEHCANGELLAVVNKAGCLEGDSLLREVLCQILIAVKALHEAGIAHRDLSLENVLVASDGGLRLIDWAQAILVRKPGSNVLEEVRVSQADGPPGKPYYRAPELDSGIHLCPKPVTAVATQRAQICSPRTRWALSEAPVLVRSCRRCVETSWAEFLRDAWT